MRYHIWTVGCQMNTADSQRLASAIEQLGYRWTDDPAAADVIILNTCVVRQQAEEKAYGRLGALQPLKAARPELVVALTGCLVGPRPDPALARRFPLVDLFLPPSQTEPLRDALLARRGVGAARQLELATDRRRRALSAGDGDGALRLPARERGRLVSAYVPIVHGCTRGCTYCVIPSRRGPERSRPLAEVEAHVRSLVDQGVREVTLLGQIVDRYGHDRGEADALPTLLRRLSMIDDLARIRFLTSHPGFLSPVLIDAVAELPKVMEHIEVPVQAGDDELLGRMKRGYTVDDYRRLVERLRRRVPGVAIHTDVIVGFCGETAAQFEATCRLLAELRLDKAHIAKYSPRPGTASARCWPDDVPAVEKERRRRRLDELQAGVCAAINAAQVGRAVEVLVEGRDRDRWRARTRTNKLVFFPDPRPLLGRLVEVRIEWSGPWSMVGRAVDAPTDADPAGRALPGART